MLDSILVHIFFGELLRKQGYLTRAISVLLDALDMFVRCSSHENSLLFQTFDDSLKQEMITCIAINVAAMYLQLGKYEDYIDLIQRSMPLDSNEIVRKYSNRCLQYIKSCVYASQGNFTNALASAINNVHNLAKFIPHDHTIMAAVYNQLGVLYATNNLIEKALHYVPLSLNIYSQTCGENSLSYLQTKFNDLLIRSLFLTTVTPVELEQCLGEIVSLYPDKHPMLSAINVETILCKENTKKFSLVWNACFVQVLDRPFTLIDYAPISRVAVFGAAQQV